MASQDENKRLVAEAAAAGVPDGIRLGLGSGSTLELFTVALAARVRAGLRVRCVPTSIRVAGLAKQHGLTLEELSEDELDLAIDGADEVDPQGGLIKGAGGALVRERIVAAAAKRFQVLVDDSKLVQRLGERMPLPVEIQTFGANHTLARIRAAVGEAQPRAGRNGDLFVSDNGGYLVDARIPKDRTPEALAVELRSIPGVVDTGFFLGFRPEVLVARGGRVDKLTLR